MRGGREGTGEGGGGVVRGRGQAEVDGSKKFYLHAKCRDAIKDEK